MIMVVDSSIWIDYIHAGETLLDELLLREEAYLHPHILGEIALGSIRNRDAFLKRLVGLRYPYVIEDGHVLSLIDDLRLWSTGLSYSDAHNLASTASTPDARLWTRDKRLPAQARRLGVAFDAP